jgi:serine/tyrosine/threonine adenylyltransferase
MLANPPLLDTPALEWQHSYFALGPAFRAPLSASPAPQPYWVISNAELGHSLGLPAGWNTQDAWLQAFSGNGSPAGSQPMASVYSGHQFGVWAGQLGDGRTLLLGELAGQEIQLKGAGSTPFSRRGDGRAVLRSSIREYLCSEAMHALGVPTTRALCLAGSDMPVYREEVETAAVLTRTAPSFVRFGHFEHFCHHDQHAQLRQLADYVIDRHFAPCREQAGNPYAAFLAEVARRTAVMVAHWQALGFCHGVMNTDNMSILGLTLDYGPFQFMDAFDPAHICNHSDTQGRYAFARQPSVAFWNLACLAQALMPLINEENAAVQALETFKPAFSRAYDSRMHAKLGFATTGPDTGQLLEQALSLLARQRVDYTLFWRELSDWTLSHDSTALQALVPEPGALHEWLQRYRQAMDAQDHSPALMRQSNPRFILRNHLAELAIRAAKEKNWEPLQTLLTVLQNPYDDQPGHESLSATAPAWAESLAISCSS